MFYPCGLFPTISHRAYDRRTTQACPDFAILSHFDICVTPEAISAGAVHSGLLPPPTPAASTTFGPCLLMAVVWWVGFAPQTAPAAAAAV